MFGKMTWYCNNCGREQYTVCVASLGRDWRVCSRTCLDEIKLKEAKSILGKNEDDE